MATIDKSKGIKLGGFLHATGKTATASGNVPVVVFADEVYDDGQNVNAKLNGETFAGKSQSKINNIIAGAFLTLTGKRGDVLGPLTENFISEVTLNDNVLSFTKGDITVPIGNVPVLDENGKISSSVLPSYVDDVIEGFLMDDSIWVVLNENGEEGEDGGEKHEVPGEEGKIYVDLNTNKTYRWSGTVFVEIVSSPYSLNYKPASGKKEYAVQQDANGNLYVAVPWQNNTDTKVTSAANHYAPAEDTAAAISAAGGGLNDAQTQVVTGLKRDAKGHVVGVTSVAVRNTIYSRPSDTVAGIVKANRRTVVSTEKNYYVNTDDDGTAYVVVPWANTTYTFSEDFSVKNNQVSLNLQPITDDEIKALFDSNAISANVAPIVGR